jgi:lysophospholipase L1-like esterase
MAMKNVRASPFAKKISKYCPYFLAADAILICVVVYVWYSLCNGSFCTTVPRKPRTNILAFGDSITKGFVKRRPVETYYPYSQSLMKTLNRLHSKDVFFIVENQGVNGDRAIGTAQARLQAALRKKQYEWVIILMGTNDLSAYFKHDNVKKLYPNDSVFVEKLFENIKKLCTMALRTHAMVILGTIAARQCEEHLPICDSLTANREALNEKIRKYVTETKELLILADFDKELHYRSMKEEKRKKYWQDDVHFTETGYEAMAKLIYNKMLPYLPEMIQQPHVSKNSTKF